MDCCGEYRAHAHAHGQYGGAGAGWDYPPYAPLPYAPYAHYYPSHAHDPYRYYRYDYPHHAHHNDHVMPMEYGAYASKEARVRRSFARRDARALAPTHHLPLPPTPPLECAMNGRGPAYCEPQMWSPYQMGLGGWNGNAVNGGWMSRNPCSREHMRYPADCRPMKGHIHTQNQVCPPDGRSTPFPGYEESLYGGENNSRNRNTPEFHAAGNIRAETPRLTRDRERDRERERERERERPRVEPLHTPPEEKRPPVVPLPAFQQAFGSTEIGKFAEAFSREVAIDDTSSDNFAFESFPDWDGPSEAQWPPPQPASREIKCEDNY